MKKKRLILLIAIIILLGFLIYYIFFYSRLCTNSSCFADVQKKCSKFSYTDNAEEATWKYTIKGKAGEECKINVELLQAKKGNVELEKLEGLEMNCYIDLGFGGSPQSDLRRCHGLLKEELQQLLIQKMHSYILSNIGKIDEALKSVV